MRPWPGFKLPYFLILCSFISSVSTSICLCLFHQLWNSLITFNHTYLKCIFIFTYILYAGKLSAGRLRLGRPIGWRVCTSSNLDRVDGPQKAASKSVSAGRRTYETWVLRELGQRQCQQVICNLYKHNRCRVMRWIALVLIIVKLQNTLKLVEILKARVSLLYVSVP